jgi:ABC-type microcin C transport system permease subunit YejE
LNYRRIRRIRQTKKGLAFLIFFIVAFVIGYTSLNWESDKENVAQAAQEVSLTNGEKMKLTAEENSLQAGLTEKKVVLTDLGMY